MHVLLTKTSALSEHLQQESIAHHTVKMFDYRRIVSLPFLRQILTSDNYDLIVLSSPSAVDIYLSCNINNNKLACISPMSAAKLHAPTVLHLTKNPYDGFNLAQHIRQNLPDQNTRILILAGTDGQNKMFEELQNYYPVVKKLEIYERIMPSYEREELEDIFYSNPFDTIVITCNTALENLLYYVNKYYLKFNLDCNLIVPSKRIADFARQKNFKNVIMAASVADHDLMAQILAVKK